MWYRIELNKDRSVKTCVEVEGSFKNSGTVHYVEAESKTAAIKWLAEAYVRTLARKKKARDLLRTGRTARNECPQCGAALPVGCRNYTCRTCIQRAKTNRTKGSKPRTRITTPEAAANQYLASRKVRCDPDLTGRLYRYQEILKQFQGLSQAAFLSWLLEKIATSEAACIENAKRRNPNFVAPKIWQAPRRLKDGTCPTN